MRRYAVKTELVNSSGNHLRFIPGELAQSMVAAGVAQVHNANGRLKSIRLVAAASTHLVRIGPPTGECASPPFSVREKLDSGRHRVAASRAGNRLRKLKTATFRYCRFHARLHRRCQGKVESSSFEQSRTFLF